MHAPSRQWLVSLLLAGFVLAQAIGLLHHTVHGQGEAHARAAPTRTQALPSSPATSWIAQLFSDHQQGSADCRLLDQLAHADFAPSVAALALPVMPPAQFVLELHGEFLARWAALFDARGPPAFR